MTSPDMTWHNLDMFLVRQRSSFLIKTIADPVHRYVHESQIYIKWQERHRFPQVSPFILLFPYAILGGRVKRGIQKNRIFIQENSYQARGLRYSYLHVQS